MFRIPPEIARYLLLFLLAIYAPIYLQADLYAVVIADTVSPTGKAAGMDLERVRRALESLARHSGIRVHVNALLGKDVTSQSVQNAVEALPITPTDMVIFYYIGHGYRTSRKDTVWPYLYIFQERIGHDFSFIVEAVIEKKPRMALLVADCCNNVMDDEFFVPWEDHPKAKKGAKKSPGPGYRALFQNFEGIVVACAAKEGDYAYCHGKGHFFTGAFLDAFHEEIYASHPQWSNILKRTGLKVQKQQTPYHEILLYP